MCVLIYNIISLFGQQTPLTNTFPRRIYVLPVFVSKFVNMVFSNKRKLYRMITLFNHVSVLRAITFVFYFKVRKADVFISPKLFLAFMLRIT